MTHVWGWKSQRKQLEFSIRHTISSRKNGPAREICSPNHFGEVERVFTQWQIPWRYLETKRETPTEKRSRKFPDALVFTSGWMAGAGSWRGMASSVCLASKEGQRLGCFSFKCPSWGIARVIVGGERKRLLHQALCLPAPAQTFLSTGL